MLFVGDDWAEDHHDVALINQEGRLLARGRLPEGVQGVEALHGLIADHLDERDRPDQVMVGIETDRGLWVAALLAADYTVFAVNPLQAARYRGGCQVFCVRDRSVIRSAGWSDGKSVGELNGESV